MRPQKMELHYSLKEEDFLAFQLFTAANSKTISRKRIRGHVLLTAGAALFALLNLLEQKLVLTLYFGATALLTGLFYPRYFRWRYKRHYLNHIREHYQNRIGTPFTLRIEEGMLYATDPVGSSTVSLDQVNRVDVLSEQVLVHLNSGVAVIVPRSALDNEGAFLHIFTDRGIATANRESSTW